jgi:hypothetical protein
MILLRCRDELVALSAKEIEVAKVNIFCTKTPASSVIHFLPSKADLEGTSTRFLHHHCTKYKQVLPSWHFDNSPGVASRLPQQAEQPLASGNSLPVQHIFVENVPNYSEATHRQDCS